MGVPRYHLNCRKRRNPHLDTAARSPLDQGCQGRLHGRPYLETIRSLTREVGSARQFNLVRDHVSSRRSPEWSPHESGEVRRCLR